MPLRNNTRASPPAIIESLCGFRAAITAPLLDRNSMA